jgi:hypothetical protein
MPVASRCQHLPFTDFVSIEAYRRFLIQVLNRRNSQRGETFTNDLKAMKVVRLKRSMNAFWLGFPGWM